MILITGATGKSGSATANELFKLGASYRALIRNPEKENDLKEMCSQGVPLQSCWWAGIPQPGKKAAE